MLPCTGGTATVPFMPERGIVEIDVLLNGRITGRFGIDTGADRVYIDNAFSKKSGLELEGVGSARQVVGIHGISEAKNAHLASLAIGDERLYDLPVTLIDMANLIKDTTFGYPDGLIGHDVLRRFYVTVDYPKHRLELDQNRPYVTKQSDRNSIPFESVRHLIIVDVTINDSIEVPMILDYCASYMSVTPELAERLGHDTDKGERLRIDRVDLGRRLSSVDVRAVVSDITKITEGVQDRSIQGVIGGTFLYSHEITVDYRGERIYVIK